MRSQFKLFQFLIFKALATKIPWPNFPWRFPKSWGYPNISLDGLFHGLFHGKSASKMDDDWGYPYDLGNDPFRRWAHWRWGNPGAKIGTLKKGVL